MHPPPSSDRVRPVLEKLNGIRQLAGNAAELRRKEFHEEAQRSLAVTHLYNVLLEDSNFASNLVKQQSFVSALLKALEFADGAGSATTPGLGGAGGAFLGGCEQGQRALQMLAHRQDAFIYFFERASAKAAGVLEGADGCARFQCRRL
eukprot:g2947.t1